MTFYLPFVGPIVVFFKVAGIVPISGCNIARYVTQFGDLNQSGRWMVQVELNRHDDTNSNTNTLWNGHSEAIAFDVGKNIS